MDGDGDGAEPGMTKVEITLPDGRYLISYTFADADADADADAGEGAGAPP